MIKGFLIINQKSVERMRGHRYITFLLLIFAYAVLHAQNKSLISFKRCPVKTISFEQGLINNSITNVITDGMGFSWFSTLTGLQRYNGYTLETITPIADGDSIRINYPVFFLSGRNNSILIGYKKGVLEYDPENNSFKKIISTDPFANLHYSLVPVKETNEGIWCLQESKGIIIYNRKGIIANQFSSSEAANIDSIIHSRNILYSRILTTNDNFIFIRLAAKKILQIDVRTHQFKYLNYTGGDIYSVACNNEKLFITASEGLSYIKINDGTIVKNFFYKQITDEQIYRSTIQLSGTHQLLVSLEKRLFEFDTSCLYLKEITTLNRELVVSTGYINFIYEDKFKRIWLLTNDDIKRIQNVEIPFEHLTYPKEKNNFVRSIYYDEQEHKLLVGCFNGGIQLYDTSGNPLWDKHLITQDVKDILSIEKLSANNYLIITIGKGLYVLNLAAKQLHAIDLSAASCSSLNMRVNFFTNNMQRINDSTFFICNGLNIFRCIFIKNEMKSATAVLSLPHIYGYQIACFIYASDKILWAGSTSGLLMRVDANGDLQTINIPENYAVRCIGEDAMHNILVGTEKGLCSYSHSGKLLNRITRETGLLNDCIYALLPADSINNFFVSTNLGLSFISTKGTVKNYAKELGLQENEFNTQASAKSSTGKLYFGGVNGITAFYPAALSGIIDTPFINITRFVINDSLYNSPSSGWKSDSIHLAYYQNHLQFDIAATGLLNPNEYIYQYRLKNFEELWQTTHQPTGIRYTLDPGKYFLEIRCSPVLSTNAVFYKKIIIIIDVPWWQTWWFRVAAFVVLVFAIALIALRYNQQKYQKKISALQLKSGIQNERERISKELHDNIGTQLSYITSNVDWMLEAPVSLSKAEETNRLSVVNNTAKAMISDLRETIWAIKKESIQLDELADKLKLFIQSQRILKPTMEINISEDIENNIRFSPTEALNIFRICQEAIVNCMKHAEASKLNVSVQSGAKENFSIEIEDNGKGFLQNMEYNGHYGLENMRSRAMELGAKLTIVSEEGNGANVILAKHNKNY
jgi:ligand-binding sensor domain-containing protein/two-component sensor histidine kinase